MQAVCSSSYLTCLDIRLLVIIEILFFLKIKLFYLTVETFYVSGQLRTKRKTRTRRRTWKRGKTCRLMAVFEKRQKEVNAHLKGLSEVMHVCLMWK